MTDPKFSLDRIADEICVNVGTPVRTKAKDDETVEDLMRHQSQKSPVWIPASLLDIAPEQAIKTTLDGDHAAEMIAVACRRPMQNAALIDLEGLPKLGLKKDQTRLVRCSSTAYILVTDFFSRLNWDFRQRKPSWRSLLRFSHNPCFGILLVNTELRTLLGTSETCDFPYLHPSIVS
jgi:hypothetical protein